MDRAESRAGIAGSTDKYDAIVEIREADPGQSGIQLVVDSPVRGLFANLQDQAVQSVLQNLSVKDADVRVQDNHALDFVLRARTSAAVARLRAAGGEL